MKRVPDHGTADAGAGGAQHPLTHIGIYCRSRLLAFAYACAQLHLWMYLLLCPNIGSLWWIETGGLGALGSVHHVQGECRCSSETLVEGCDDHLLFASGRSLSTGGIATSPDARHPGGRDCQSARGVHDSNARTVHLRGSPTARTSLTKDDAARQLLPYDGSRRDPTPLRAPLRAPCRPARRNAGVTPRGHPCSCDPCAYPSVRSY